MSPLTNTQNAETINIIKAKYNLNNDYVFNVCLPDGVVIFIDTLTKILKQMNIPFYFDSGSELLGFRYSSDSRFFCYINTDYFGDYYIHIFNKKANYNKRLEFVDQSINAYISEILHNSFLLEDMVRVNARHLTMSFKGYDCNFMELLDEYDSDPSSFNEIMAHLDSKGFIYTEDEEHIYFYSKEDLDDDIKEPWFTFYKKQFFGPDYLGVYSYYNALGISYSLKPGEKKLNRYARFPLMNKVSYIIELIDKVIYHRTILKELLSHSVYGNIIRCTNGYESEFPDDFKDIQKYINYDVNHNEFISTYHQGENYPGIYKYSDAIDFYVRYKYQVLKAAIMDNCINMDLTEDIVDQKEFDQSLYECIKNKDYDLSSLKGVNTNFLKVLDDNYYDFVSLFTKYDCESIKENLLGVE